MKKQKNKTMKVEIIGTNKNVGVMIDGEIRKPGDVVEVGLLTARSLIARERAVNVLDKKDKAEDSAEATDKATGKASK